MTTPARIVHVFVNNTKLMFKTKPDADPATGGCGVCAAYTHVEVCQTLPATCISQRHVWEAADEDTAKTLTTWKVIKRMGGT
jgi:hypothetical protein